jgi:hypothetical protein
LIMTTDTFEDFLKKKNGEDKKIDWEARKMMWIKSVDDFYDEVYNWLYPFKQQSLLQIHKRGMIISEEYLGTYTVNQMDILLGNDIVSLIPRGTLILGSYGRIDMRGPKGDRLLVEQKWNEWRFSGQTSRRDFWDVNEESFKSAIQEVVNG